MSGRTRLTGRKQPPPSLVQNWLNRLEASLDGSDVNHQARISAPAIGSRQFADPFVAFLSVPRFFPSDSLILAQALSQLRAAGQQVGAIGWPQDVKPHRHRRPEPQGMLAVIVIGTFRQRVHQHVEAFAVQH
jgi:hypothetical protein